MLSGQLNWLSDPIYCILVDTVYYVYSSAHATLEDVSADAFVISSPLLTGRTAANGVADADDVTFPPVVGKTCRACLIVKDGGTALQSKLIAYIDTAAGLPFEANNQPLRFTWDDGPNRIFAL